MDRLSKITGHLVGGVSSPRMSTNPTGSNKHPINVTITGAAGNIGYQCIWQMGQGALFGKDQPINLTMLDLPQAEKAMQGVAMEISDSSFSVFNSVKSTSDYKEGFLGCQAALLIGARPRGKGMERADLLKGNAKIFEGQGKAIDAYAHKNVKVLVVGNPCNTNALICSMNAPSIPKKNFTAMTRLDQSRSEGQIAARVGVNCSQLKNIFVWGNHSPSMVADINHGYVADYPAPGMKTPIVSAVNDSEWLTGGFLDTIGKRGGAIIKARGASSAASAAKAALDHMRDWFLGTEQGRVVSMGVVSNGEYGAPEGVMFSFPCTTSNGEWKIMPGLKLDAETKRRIKITGDELVKERALATGN